MIEVNNMADLRVILDTNERVVVVFSARDWCVPCRRLHPHAEAAEKRLPGIVFVEVDIDKAPDVRKQYDILSVPNVIAFEEGSVQKILSGRTAAQLIADLA